MLFMTYQKAKEVQFELEEALRAAKEGFLDLPKDKGGYTTAAARRREQYNLILKTYNKAEKALRVFNEMFEIEFRDEIRAEKKRK